MGQSDSKVRRHRITKHSKEINSVDREAKSSTKNLKRPRLGRERSSRKSKKRGTKEKRKSSTFRRRFSKKTKYPEEDRTKELISDDTLSSASIDTIDSRRIKTTVLSGIQFWRKGLLDFDSSSEYCGQGYRNSTLLFASLDQDPELSGPAGVEYEDTTKLGLTDSQSFDGSANIESLHNLEPPQSQPILNEATESSTSIQLTHSQASREGSYTKEMLAKKDSELSEKLLGDTQQHTGSTTLDCTENSMPIFLISASCGSLAADSNERPSHSFSKASMDDICSKGKSKKSSGSGLLSKLRSPRMSYNKRKTSVQFQLGDFDNPVTQKSKVWSKSLGDVRKGKTYGSVKLRKKKQNKSVSAVLDKAIGPWTMSADELDVPDYHNDRPIRTSAIHERDLFLELLSQVQDNRYENQRYTLKAGSINDTDNDDVFDVPEKCVEETDIIPVNGTFHNGTLGSTSPDLDLPSIEVSPMCTLQSSSNRHSVSLSGLDACHDNDEMPDIQSPVDTPRQSLSPPIPSLLAGSALTPGRKSMEALKKMIESEGPYPLLIEAPDGGYWIQNGEYESAKGEDEVWRAPEISTEHYTIQCDLTALAYGGHFHGQDHSNYIARDPTVGPVLLSLKFEEVYQGTQVRAILRTQAETMYKVIPQLSEGAEIKDYIKHVSGDKLETDNAFKIDLPKATELIRKFDEHPVAKAHKIGIVYQQYGQTTEEEIFGNLEHPDSLDEFLNMLGTKVNLKGFEGYRGGLDVANDQTGECSVYTEYKDRQIMFHVSTLLPHDASDTQHVQKKRHIGNDIVVIVFQEENTPFCPSTIRSHFIHSYIVVQVEHPNTDHTVYKVAITAKDEVPNFGPPLPDPAVFQKGTDFRDWLLTKILNAEYKCHMAPSFNKLASRTRGQLFLHLVEEIAQSMEDVDYPSLTKGLAMVNQGSGSDVRSPKNRRRRKTLGGIFGTKKESALALAFPKRKSISGSPRIYRKLLSEPSSPRDMIVGSTPDLATSLNEQPASGYPVILANGQPSLGHATPDLAELSRGEGKGRFRRRFTLKKDKDEPKERKKPKRTKSVGGPAGHTLADYFKKRKDSTSPVTKRSPVKRDSSEESSISSSLNWSVPYDLPSVVEAEISAKHHHQQLKAQTYADDFHVNPSRCLSNPTILERRESEVSVSDVHLTLKERPKMVDAAVQVTPYDWSSPFFSSSSYSTSDHHRGVKVSPLNTRSLQGSPGKQRKSSLKYERRNGHSMSPPPVSTDRQSQDGEGRQLENVLKSIQSSPSLSISHRQISQSGELNGAGYEDEEMVLHRAESTDSISTDVGDLYDSLLQSLQSLTDDVAKLREQNLILSNENVKFATQNNHLKERHRSMKNQLSITQKQIHTLQLKLRLYQPNFPYQDQDDDDDHVTISHV